MNGVNKAIIIGTLGKDPETRFMPSGEAVTNFSVATSESWKDKKTGDKQEATEWHNITIFGKLAEIADQYLKKGSQVYLEGKIKTEKYEKDGITRYSTKIIAFSMQMLGGKQESNSAPKPAQQPVQQSIDDSFDDDIPF